MGRPSSSLKKAKSSFEHDAAKRVMHAGRGFDGNEIHARRDVEIGGTGYEEHRMAFMSEGTGERIAHFP